MLGQLLRGFALSFAAMTFESTCRLMEQCQAWAAVGPGGGGGHAGGAEPAAAAELTPLQSPPPASDAGSDVSMQLESDEEDDLEDDGENVAPQTPLAAEPQGGAVGSPPLPLQPRSAAQVESFLMRCGAGGASLEAALAAEAAEHGGGDGGHASAEALLASLAEAVPSVAQTHYLRYADLMRRRDFTAAVSALHTYFDYTAGQPLYAGKAGEPSAGIFDEAAFMPDASGALPPAGRGGVGSAAPGALGGLGRWQSALLSLGAAHAQMGHGAEALRALDECVRLAQAHCDEECLTHALAAACALLADDPAKALEHSALLARCRRRAYELGMPAVAAFAELSLARACLRQAAPPPPPHRAADAAGEELPRGRAPLAVWRLLHSAEAAAAAAAPSDGGAACVSAHLARAEAWEHHGCAPLAAACVRAAASIHIGAATEDDAAAAEARLLLLEQHSPDTGKAAAVRGAATEDTSARLEWARARLACSRAVAADDAAGAREAAARLAALAAYDGSAESAMAAEAARCDALLVAGLLPEARSAAAGLFTRAYAANAQPVCVQALLALCATHAASGAAAVSLPYALAARSLARRLHMDMLEAEASVAAAELWLALGKGARGHRLALPLLRAAAPRCAAHGGAMLSARCQLALARAQLRAWGRRRLATSADEALAPIRAAESGFEAAGAGAKAAEAAHLFALVADALGRTEERNAASERFCALQRQLAAA